MDNDEGGGDEHGDAHLSCSRCRTGEEPVCVLAWGRSTGCPFLCPHRATAARRASCSLYRYYPNAGRMGRGAGRPGSSEQRAETYYCPRSDTYDRVALTFCVCKKKKEALKLMDQENLVARILNAIFPIFSERCFLVRQNLRRFRFSHAIFSRSPRLIFKNCSRAQILIRASTQKRWKKWLSQLLALNTP